MKRYILLAVGVLCSFAQAEWNPGTAAKYKLIVFDLDGTLSKSKCAMEKEMSVLLARLLEIKSVAVISGGSYAQFQKQFLASLDCKKELLSKMYLFPTCSTVFYRFDGNAWVNVYAHMLSSEERSRIIAAFQQVIQEVGHKPEVVYGDIIEDRGSQVTFSALGQQAPLEAKKMWDPDNQKRQAMKKKLELLIPEFEIRIGGATSIDVTHKGIDKKFGIEQIERQLGFTKNEIAFVGDALFEGGNDYPVKATGVDCIAVDAPEGTMDVIRSMIAAHNLLDK